MYDGALDDPSLVQAPDIDSDMSACINEPILGALTADSGDDLSASFSISENCLETPSFSQQSFPFYDTLPNQGFFPASGPSSGQDNRDSAIPITDDCQPTLGLFDIPASFAHASSIFPSHQATEYQPILALDRQGLLAHAHSSPREIGRSQPRDKNGRFIGGDSGITTSTQSRAIELKRKPPSSATSGLESTKGRTTGKKLKGDVPRESENGPHLLPASMSANSIITATLTAQRSLLQSLQTLYDSEMAFATSNIDLAYSRVVSAKNSLRKHHLGGKHCARSTVVEQEPLTLDQMPGYYANQYNMPMTKVQQIEKLPAEGTRRGVETIPTGYIRQETALDKQRQEIRNFANGRGKCYTKKGQELATAIGVVEKTIGTLESHRDTAFTGML
ncbi:MAG: hypothetical protein Q9160_008837 [Pyrenula sp. 1 TL-2023]